MTDDGIKGLRAFLAGLPAGARVQVALHPGPAIEVDAAALRTAVAEPVIRLDLTPEGQRQYWSEFCNEESCHGGGCEYDQAMKLDDDALLAAGMFINAGTFPSFEECVEEVFGAALDIAKRVVEEQ